MVLSEKEFSGLNPDEVLLNREKYGRNVITPVKRESVWKLLMDKFNDPIIRILMVAAFLSLVVGFAEGEFAEAIGIICAIFLATGVSFWFEYDAKKRFELLNIVNDDVPVKVMRGGDITEVPRKDIVVGDIVLLDSGDEVPADGQLHQAISLKVNESSLTGEPVADKTTDTSQFNEESTYPPDRILRGTTVVEGNGIMEVDAVGDSTEFGKVAEQATVESGEDTPLNKQLKRLSRLIGRLGGALAVAVFLILFVKGAFFGGDLLKGDFLHIANRLLGYFMVSVAIIVVAVPEGLPMSITLSLAMSMRRMLKTNNLVRKMHACETMGAVTVICTDKTGTLTRNEMRVREFIRYTEISDELVKEMLSLNSTAFIDAENKVIGNPTEGALLLWLRDSGSDYAEIRRNTKTVDRLTFTTDRKYMATIVESAVTGKRMIYVKGAPEIVRKMCISDNRDAEIDSRLREFQNMAMRTIGFAFGETSFDTCEDAIRESGLAFAAIAAIDDPVRDDVPEAVGRCLRAGIDVKIITGDTAATAREIARRVGLWNDAVDSDINSITGAEFEAMSDGEAMSRIDGIKIMSRARPLDKQRLVQLLQSKGEVVAVTGDGTNDAPALNFAHIGLSMGSGTSVAKEASDITLLDDSFGSIATAVMWGRSLYKNIQRFLLFQLTVNLVAMAVVFIGSVFGKELPLTVTQMLWVNIIMDTFAAMAFASLPPDPKVMEEKPRRESDFVITRPIRNRILSVGAVMTALLLAILFHWGYDVTVYQLTVFFTLFVMLHFWNLFNAKSFGFTGGWFRLRGYGAFYLILLLILAGQIIIVTVGGNVFRTVPLSPGDWLITIAGTSLIMIMGVIAKITERRRPEKQ